MLSPDFDAIREVLDRCIRKAFTIDRPGLEGGLLFEADEVHKDNKSWLAIAAGIDAADSKDFFSGHAKRAQRSTVPLNLGRSCEMSILFVARPADEPLTPDPLRLIVPFARRDKIPFLELRNAHLRLWGIPGNANNLADIRWEWDVPAAQQDPRERWLREWKSQLGFNPAHPASHLHANTGPSTDDEAQPVRPGDRTGDLRLAMGNPNPLALILSIAAWFRSQP